MEHKILGVNHRGYSTEQGDPKQYGVGITQVTTILVAGGNNDYAAYEGVGSEQFIASHGHKLPFDEAVVLFPWISPMGYRR